MSGFGFDLRNVDVEDSKNNPLPVGTYTAKIEKVEKRESKNNSANKYLNVMYKVTGMEKRNGAVFFDIVNVYNQNEQAQNIGRKRLKSMLIASGATEDNISTLGPEFLIGKTVSCVLGVEKDSQYGDRNKVLQILSSETKAEKEDETKKAPSWL